MALSAGQVSLSVKPDTKKFGSDLADGISSQSGMFSGLGAKIGGLVAGGIALAGFGELVKQATEASDATQKFGSTLQFAGIATDQIKALTASTQDYANQTVYGLSDIQNITAQLASNGVPHFDQLAEAAGNLNAIAGGTADTYKSVGMVLTQTAGQGKLTTENWNQLSDAIPGASGKLQDALLKAGAYTGNFRDAMAKGQITAGEFNDAIMKLGFDPVAVSAARSTTTIEGALGNLQASAVTALSGIITFVKPAITGAMNAVSSGISTVTAAVSGMYSLLTKGDFTSAFRTAFHVEEDSSFTNVMFNMRDAVTQFAQGIKVGTDAAGSSQSRFAVWGASVYSAAANARGAVSAFFDGFKNGTDSLTSSQSIFAAWGASIYAVADSARVAIVRTGQELLPALAAIQGAFAGLWPTIQPLIPGLVNLVLAFSPLHTILTAILPYLPDLVQAVGLLAAALAGTLAGAVTSLMPSLTALGAVFSTSIVAAVQTLIPVVMALTTFLSDNAYLVGVAVAAWLTWRAVSVVLDTVKAAQVGMAAASLGLAGASSATTAAQKVAYVTTLLLNGALQAHALALFDDGVAAARNAAAWVANAAVQVGIKAVMIGSAIATGIATAATWALNGALAVLTAPITLVIVAIVALVAAIIWVATQTTFFQDAWRVAMSAIGTATTWLWASVINPVIQGIAGAWNWLLNSVIVPIVNGISFYIRLWAAIFLWLWAYAIEPVIQGMVTGWNLLMAVIQVLWAAHVQPVITGIGAIFLWLWNSVINPVVNYIVASWNRMIAVLQFVGATVATVVNTVGGFFTWLWASVVSIVVGFIVERWNFLGSVIRAVWSGVIQPAINAVGSAFSTVSSIIGGVVSTINGAIRSVGDAVHNVFSGIGDFIGGAFQRAAGLIKAPLNVIIGGVNQAIDGINGVGGAVGVHLNRIPMLAKGGTITAPGQVIVGENGPELLTLPTGASVNPNINAGNSTSGGDRPIYADGVGLIAWIRELANGEARLVWAQGEQATATAAGMGWSVNR